MKARLKSVRKKLRQIRKLELASLNALTPAQRLKLGKREVYESELAELVALVEAASIDRSLPPTVPPPPTRRVASSLNPSCPPTRPSVFLGAIDHPEGSAGAFVRTTRRDWAQKIKRFGEPAAEQLARALTRFIAELRSIEVWHKVDVLVHSHIERFGARLRWNVEANAPVRRPLSAAEVHTFFL